MDKISRIFLIACLCGMVMLTAGCGDDSSSHSTTTEPTDEVALAGETTGKLFFDINLSDAAKLPLYLSVIQQTYDGLEAQDVTPDFVVVFRGMAVTFITNEAADADLKAQIIALAALPNIRLEACAIATGLFGVDNGEILSDINVVGNTFISAAGFQAVGYAPILVQ